jgi:hypothetical protein
MVPSVIGIGRATIFSIAEWEAAFCTPSLRSYMSFVSAAALLPLAANLREEVAGKLLHVDLTGCVRDHWHPKEAIKLGMMTAMVCDECRATFPRPG